MIDVEFLKSQIQNDELLSLRQDAFIQFEKMGLPDKKNEDWKYTSVSEINELIPSNSINIVFFDGQIELFSSSKNAEYFKQHQKHGFNAMNSALADEGYFIQLDAHQKIKDTIHVFFISSNSNCMSNLRNIIVAGEGSDLKIVEHFVSIGADNYVNNVITDVYIEEGASVHHSKIQDECKTAFHFGETNFYQKRNSASNSFSFSCGGKLVRSDTNVYFQEQDSISELNGLFLAKDNQHVDHHTTVEHNSPGCQSSEYYKGMLGKNSRGVFNGKIIVAQGAHNTKAEQMNKNLLLSRSAEIDTKPQLEIYADDVQCTHGATVGQLDDDAKFFLKSRGISEAEAVQLLTQAFAQEIIDKVLDEGTKSHLTQLLNDWSE